MIEKIVIPVISALITWLLSHFYYRKERRNDLENKLIERINDLSEKYILLNEKYTNLFEKLNQVQRENKELKSQLISMKKGK